ncbi:MAG: spondin domain-containing protein [Gemmatimonadetes bacterium]|nr:spondin domain-containing protein [Gemmatimonadota bacterium]
MRRPVVATLTLLGLAACTEGVNDVAPVQDVEALTAAHDTDATDDVRVYEVTVHNLTANQAFTPPVAATHRWATTVFALGQPASGGVQQIAENGNIDPLVMALSADPHVGDVQVGLGPVPPVLPGTARTFEISAPGAEPVLSFVSMLICTNDGFTGVNKVVLPRAVGEMRSWSTRAYDAGTEVNTESFADLVPPCPSLSGVPSTVPGTGMSNPALAENGRVHRHYGIEGGGDLTPSIHDWRNPVARLEITRVR